MKRLNWFFVWVLAGNFLNAQSHAQAKQPPNVKPLFESFPVTSNFSGNPAQVDFKSDPQGKRFKTMLTKGIKRGVNFAGEYTIVRWGCGFPCGMGAILHTPTGKICAWFNSCGEESFRPDSRLLILDPRADSIPEFFCKTQFLVWNGHTLEELPNPTNPD